MINISKLLECGKVYIQDCKTQEELYNFLAKELSDEGYVKDSFLHALKTREAQFPTGIVANPYNIALPHVDSEHVNKNALIITILDDPIAFHRMDKLNEIIEVKVVFMLLIENLEFHMQAISNLTKLWMDKDFMDAVLTVCSKEEMIELVKKSED